MALVVCICFYSMVHFLPICGLFVDFLLFEGGFFVDTAALAMIISRSIRVPLRFFVLLVSFVTD